MNSGIQCLETETFSVKREWTADGVPVLTAALALPRPADRSSRTAKRIDRFYQLQGRSYLRYCGEWLFPQAEADYRQALAAGSPLKLRSAELNFRVTCSERGVWSVYTQTCEQCGGRRTVTRRGDTWNLVTGYPLPLSAFFPKHFPIRKTLLHAAETELLRREACGLARCHERWRQELRRTFNRENFYLTPDGLCFFWQMGTAAAAAEGIPTFRIPFGEAGCQWPFSEPEN